MFADPNRWGCVFVVKNPYATDPFHLLFQKYAGNEYCPPVDPSTQQKTWDQWAVTVIDGYLKAYDGLVKFYNGVKGYIAEKVAELVPCEALGEDLETSCEDAAAFVVSSAISAAMVYAGVPPTYPSLDAIKAAGKGKIVDAAVVTACQAIEANGGECTPEIKQGLSLAFEQGIDQLQQGLVKQTSEPDCGDAQLAKEHGVLPMPCFMNYPGTEVHPAKGSVYEPPVVRVQVTKTKSGPSGTGARAATPHKPISCEVTAGLTLSNEVNDKTISGIHYPHVELSGRPFDFTSAHIPRLAVGQSVDMPLSFAKMLPVDFPGSIETHFNALEWVYLYIGGKGPLKVLSGCAVNSDKISVQIPKT